MVTPRMALSRREEARIANKLVDALLECPSGSPMVGMWPKKRRGRVRGAAQSPTVAELNRLDQSVPQEPKATP